MMRRHFNRHLEGLDVRFWHDLIESRGRLVTLKRGEHVCRIGERSDSFGYVKSGYLIYGCKARNIIGGFAFEQALWGDWPSCLNGLPARLDIVAGRKSEIWVMDGTALTDIFDEGPELSRRQMRIFMEQAYVSLLDRYMSLYSKDPKQRYLDLIREHPQIEQDVPQKEIARYLQITPITLCRIRKGLLSAENDA